MSSATATTFYVADRDYVLAILRRRCGWLDPSDREALVHDAYAVLLEKQRDGLLDIGAMRSQQIRAYLTQTALNKALDEGKRAGRRRCVPIAEADRIPDDRGHAVVDDVDAATDRARIQEILAELPERQQAIVKLRFFLDRSPNEIQRYLNVTSRVYRRDLERALKSVAERYEQVREGTFCDSRRSIILAYVAGIAGPSRVREARRHLATCPGCARWAAELRASSERVAAAISVPPMLHLDHRPQHAVERLVDLLGSAKQAVAGVVGRADLTIAQYGAGARPGVAAAAIAGCLAIGGTATYCAVEGLPQPLRILDRGAREVRPSDDAPRAAKPRERKPVASPAAVRPTPTPLPDARPERRASAPPSRPRPPKEKTSARPATGHQVAREFGPEIVDGPAPVAPPSTTVPEFGP